MRLCAQKWQLWCTVHGDDFTTLGPRELLEWMHRMMSESWECKLRGILGPPHVDGTLQHIVVLNRLVTWDNRATHMEADPRHVDLILGELGAPNGNISTPIVRLKHEEVEDETPLSSAEVTQYRSLCMRAMYISQDRPDLMIVTRELSKGMQKPVSTHLTMMKPLGRYLVAHGRVVQHFCLQPRGLCLDGWTDYNHTGCIRSRKSTSGFCAMAGSHVIFAQEGAIALSSAEAEYYALVSGASALLGLQSVARDWLLES